MKHYGNLNISDSSNSKQISIKSIFTQSNDTTYNIGGAGGWIDYINNTFYVSNSDGSFYILESNFNTIDIYSKNTFAGSFNSSNNRLYLSSLDYNSIYYVDTLTYTFNEFYFGSPLGTLWNSDFTDTSYGWGDLSDYTTRTYKTFRQALNNNIGNNVVGRELIMWDTINDKYYKVIFSFWQNGGNGGGFTYDRAEIIDPVTFGVTVSFSKPNYGTQSDYIDNRIAITRDNDLSIYNPLEEVNYSQSFQTDMTQYNPVDNKVYSFDYYNSSGNILVFDEDLKFHKIYQALPESPVGTLWNSDLIDRGGGWSDLTNYQSRKYVGFVKALEYSVGNNVVGRELIMWDTINNKYYKVIFSFWQSSSGGGGFTYDRAEIIDPVTFGPTVSFTKTNYGTEEDIIDSGVTITRGNNGAIFNSAVGETNYDEFDGWYLTINTNNGEVYFPGKNGFMGIYSTAGDLSFMQLPFIGNYCEAIAYNPVNNKIYIGDPTNAENIYSIDANTKVITTINISSFVPNTPDKITKARWVNSKIIVSVYDSLNKGVILNIDNSDVVSILKNIDTGPFDAIEVSPSVYAYISNSNLVLDEPETTIDLVNTIIGPVSPVTNVTHQLQATSGVIAHLSDISITTGAGLYLDGSNNITSALATTRYIMVSTTGNDLLATADKYNRPFATINAAINVATATDIVVILPGDHYIASTIYNRTTKIEIHAMDGANIFVTSTYWFIHNGGSGGIAPEIIIKGRGKFNFTSGFYRNYGSTHTGAKLYFEAYSVDAGTSLVLYTPTWLEDSTNSKEIVVKAEAFTHNAPGSSVIYSESTNDYISFHINGILRLAAILVNTYYSGTGTVIDVKADQIIYNNQNIQYTCLIYIGGTTTKVDVGANLITATCSGTVNGLFHFIGGNDQLMNIDSDVKLLKGYLTGVSGNNTINFYKKIELMNSIVPNPNNSTIYNTGGKITFYGSVTSNGQYIYLYGGRTEFLGTLRLLGGVPDLLYCTIGGVGILNQIDLAAGVNVSVGDNGKLYLNKDVIGSFAGPVISMGGNAYLDVKACKIENLNTGSTSSAVSSGEATDKIVSNNARFIVNAASDYSIKYTLGLEATLYSYGGTYQNKPSENTPVLIGEAVTVNTNII